MKSKGISLTAESVDQATAAIMRLPLTRRELLKGTGMLFGTLAASSGLAAFAPSRSWALPLQRLNSHEGQVLLAFVKRIYPHATLDDTVYALVLKDLDKNAAGDNAIRAQLSAGVRDLDKRAGGDWSKRAIENQDTDVAAVAGTPFFATVRSTAVVSLYSNTLAYAHFGYGASEGDHGYLHKGFDNLSWLPDPPAQDSGPIPSDN